ncbi:MAG: T9SS type A sorting domain-containing protein [Bacteroidota bacterium]
MRYIAFIIIILSNLIGWGQDLRISPHANWTYVTASEIPQTNDFPYLTTYSVIGDSLIDNESWPVLQSFYTFRDSIITVRLPLAIQDRRLLFHEAGEWKLLCDFNLETGDTLRYQIPQEMIAFDVQCILGSGPALQAMAVVDSVSFRPLESLMLKQLHLSPISAPGFDDWELGLMTELLSSEYGFFGRSAKPCPQTYPGELRCFQDKLCEDDEGYTFGFQVGDQPCQFIRIADGCGPSEYGLARIISIEDGLIIEPTNRNELPLQIEVFELSGKQVYQETLSDLEIRRISQTNWTRGIYVVRVLGQTDFVSKKVWLNP